MSSTASGGDPVAAIRRFVGRPDLPLVCEGYGRWHLPYPGRSLPAQLVLNEFETGYFRVDEAGCLRDARMSPEVVPLFGTVPAAGAPIDCPTALRAAETFLAGRLEWFSRLELYRQETVNRGWAPGGYPYDLHQYMWEARHGRCRAWGLGSVHVSVDSVGSLVSFVQYPPTLVAVSLEPTITRDEAIALALARYGEPTTASEAELRIGLSDHGDGSQELYWRVTLTGTKPWCNDSVRLEGASYAFDAHSGKLLWQFVSQNYPESSPDETGEESR